MKRDDIDLIINACDAGREGELIFRYLVKLAGIRKPLSSVFGFSPMDSAVYQVRL